MSKINVPKKLANQINEIIAYEASEKERIFDEFLRLSGFDNAHHRSSIDKKVDILAQNMQKLEYYNKKPQNLRLTSANQSDLLKNLSADFDSLSKRLQSVSDSLKSISKLPQLQEEVKGVEIEALSEAAKNFESQIKKSAPLPDYFDPTLMKNLRVEVTHLQDQVSKLQDDISQFKDIGTDFDIAYQDVVKSEAMLSQMQKENDLASGFSGWK